jgi:predicted GIY-YIG superfamily endonuclease
MSIGIYMIKNLSNNKVYIGQSIDIKRRWNKIKLE